MSPLQPFETAAVVFGRKIIAFGRTQIVQTQPQDWLYVSEGGATIVFAYAGPPHPEFDGKVLRLRKKSTIVDATNAVKDEEPDDAMVAFQRRVISRLVPSQHLPELEFVLLDPSWLNKLAELREADRPQMRRSKDRIDSGKTKGILSTDLVGREGLAVEIKPKWGFLPCATHLSPPTAHVKTHTCRFCMHTYSRSAEKGDNILSAYCPLDLFSGDRQRILNALHNLWMAWYNSDGSHNNLKLFAEGKLVKPSNKPMMDLLSTSLAAESSDSASLEGAFANAIIDLILESPVFQMISSLQQSLDPLDVEGVAKLYMQEHQIGFIDSKTSILGSDVIFDPSLGEWEDFIDAFTNQFPSWDHSNPQRDHLRHYLMAQLLSGTFKDCSVILQPQIPRTSLDFMGKVTIIDLDVKGMSRLSKWQALDREIVECYLGNERPKQCVVGSLE
ncbi:inositol-pentakisphosphate 2-kinase [Hygrophoropsis aurantiaca]|uniref:Inositol-pentakisphosphate 2-kinase n=1 Tax=Hygrophoropsis aurantiaca TaxID=72124 RepID=A0ACB8ASF9_9AGAM|nr:inositol-pentakisphosphate 2-kinase [Hygrophoropsis aurantiaca]